LDQSPKEMLLAALKLIGAKLADQLMASLEANQTNILSRLQNGEQLVIEHAAALLENAIPSNGLIQKAAKPEMDAVIKNAANELISQLGGWDKALFAMMDAEARDAIARYLGD
jgi:hypothetical protein